ncbi:ATP-binding protein [Paenibacillus sp. GYB004]|uniref:ATP-binding protein n=1 Tax=Paenibacillus sp. GYB004 TaxID=2994393 RepID=UPI002F96637D
MKTTSISLRNELPELERLRLFLNETAEALGMDNRALYRVNLICDELVTNIISYGYGEGQEGSRRIEIGLALNGEVLDISISDDGIAFNPLNRPEPDVEAGLEDRKIGGLGIHFAKSLTESKTYARVEGRNELRLTMRLRQHEEEEETDEHC